MLLAAFCVIRHHAEDSTDVGVKLVLTWKLLLYRVAFTVLEGAVHITGGEK